MAISSNISELDNTIPLSTELLEDIYIIGSDVNSSSIKVDPTKRATVAVTDIQEFAAKVDLLVKEDSKIKSSLISFNKLNERLIPENLNLQYKQVSISPIGLDEVLSSDATYVNVVAEAPYVGLKAVNIEQPKLNDIQVALSPGALKAANVYVEGRSSADSVVIYNTDSNFYGLRTVTITDLPISSLISHTVTPGELSTSDTITINGVSDEAFGTAAVEVSIPLISSGHFLINTNTLANQPLKPSAGDYALDGTRLDEGTIALGYKTVSFDVDLEQLSSESIIAKAKDNGGILEPGNTAIGYDSAVIPALEVLSSSSLIAIAKNNGSNLTTVFGYKEIQIPKLLDLTSSNIIKASSMASGDQTTITPTFGFKTVTIPALEVCSSSSIIAKANNGGGSILPSSSYLGFKEIVIPEITETASGKSTLTGIYTDSTVSTTGPYLCINSSCGVVSSVASTNVIIEHDSNKLGLKQVTINPINTYDYYCSVASPLVDASNYSEEDSNNYLVIESIDPDLALRSVRIPPILYTGLEIPATDIIAACINGSSSLSYEPTGGGSASVFSSCTVMLPDTLTINATDEAYASAFTSLLFPVNPVDNKTLTIDPSGIYVGDSSIFSTEAEAFLAGASLALPKSTNSVMLEASYSSQALDLFNGGTITARYDGYLTINERPNRSGGSRVILSSNNNTTIISDFTIELPKYLEVFLPKKLEVDTDLNHDNDELKNIGIKTMNINNIIQAVRIPKLVTSKVPADTSTSIITYTIESSGNAVLQLGFTDDMFNSPANIVVNNATTSTEVSNLSIYIGNSGKIQLQIMADSDHIYLNIENLRPAVNCYYLLQDDPSNSKPLVIDDDNVTLISDSLVLDLTNVARIFGINIIEPQTTE
jgi:hypothetical protein